VRIRFALVVVFVAVSCGGEKAVEPPPRASATVPDAATTVTVPRSERAAVTTAQDCAHVVDVVVRPVGDTYAFDVAVRSTETGWDKYADAWRVAAPDGSVLGVRELAHPHEDEQPFTRSLSGVEIPPEVDHVTVAARDSVLGYCGDTMTVDVLGRS
jgi:hypothetical protein